MTNRTQKELEDWANKLDKDKLFSHSANKDISKGERQHVYRCASRLGKKEPLSFKSLNWLFDIVNRIEEKVIAPFDDVDLSITDAPSSANHLCLRMAWHDNKWNGHVCDRPDENIYCNGEHSLLSERIRKRKNTDKECEKGCAGCPATKENLGDYQPPCFWSINAFGNQELNFEHDNPVASDFPKINESLPPYSVISWPFKLSFTRDKGERDQYGSYYPKDIFENRIKTFHNAAIKNESLVFVYCKYSNPVSGEDMQFLVAGCALLADKGELNWFDITEEQLAAKQQELRQPNFPSLNWALRYSLDFEGTGVRLPYHEYIAMVDDGISEEYLQQIAVTISEPELREGFTYVAQPVDDDQAIYLLMKIRKSLLLVDEHGICAGYDVNEALTRIDALLSHVWKKRGYMPGLLNLLCAIPALKDDYRKEIPQFVNSLELSNGTCIDILMDSVKEEAFELDDRFDSLVQVLSEFIDEQRCTIKEFLRLASLNLTAQQFSRIMSGALTDISFKEVCRNPYLLFESYVPGVNLQDKNTGIKVDGLIDLFKIDLALFPHIKYLKKLKGFHDFKTDDYRRLRAVTIDILNSRESNGDCYLEAGFIDEAIKSYPLFYKNNDEYRVKESFGELSDKAIDHFSDKVVQRKFADQVFYYLKDLYDDELYISDIINKFLDHDSYDLDVSALISNIDSSSEALSGRIGESFDVEVFKSERKRLFENIVNRKLYVLTGGAGSGKSYELLNTINFLVGQGETHLVLTLTGKAALRLRNDNNFNGVNVKTIDKFLTEQRHIAAQQGARIIHNLIIDEASMVDLPKLAELLRLVGVEKSSFKRLILVGDENQLPPIGFGKPFADIIHYVKNQQKYREQSFISLESNCRAELTNNFVDFTRLFSGHEKFSDEKLGNIENEGDICDGGITIEFWHDKQSLEDKIKNNLEGSLNKDGKKLEELPAYFGIDEKGKKAPDNIERFQILSPKINGFYGVSGINQFFQNNINKIKNFVNSSGETAFRLSEKVMHTKNEYRKNEMLVSNGSMGAIVGNNKVFFSDLEKAISFKQIDSESLQLAYAISVHKSQGSGFEEIVIVIPSDSKFVSKELFYTALTRAKSKVVLLFQKPSDDYSITSYLRSIQKNSAIGTRRTTLLQDEYIEYGYCPAEGVYVKSRVEYIIYKQLQKKAKETEAFSFVYEERYELEEESYNYHPDFVLHLADGRTIYWEHLGKVTSPSYLRMWDKRKKTYKDKGDIDKVLTTDELNGIDNYKIEKIIDSIIANQLESEDASNRFSNMHISLR